MQYQVRVKCVSCEEVLAVMKGDTAFSGGEIGERINTVVLQHRQACLKRLRMKNEQGEPSMSWG